MNRIVPDLSSTADVDSTTLALLVVASIPAVVAAVFAARGRARSRDEALTRRRGDREARRKQQVYGPVLDLLEHAVDGAADPTDDHRRRVADSVRWVALVGSADAERACRELTQGILGPAPPERLRRLLDDFRTAAGRDLGWAVGWASG